MADQDLDGTTNAGIVARRVTGQMNAGAEDETLIEMEVDQDAEVTHVIKDDPLQEVEDQAAVIQETLTEEKEDVSVAKREVTLEQTALTIGVVAEIRATLKGEEMIVDMVAEMAHADENAQEVDHPRDVEPEENMILLGALLEATRPHPVITDVMTAEAPIQELITDLRLLKLGSNLTPLEMINHFERRS